jgi:hypothetical protein
MDMQKLKIGYNKIFWETSKLSSGIYFVNCNMNGKNYTKKVLLIK